MKLDDLQQELSQAYEFTECLMKNEGVSEDTQVFYFDGAQSWDIELMVATHRTGNTVWIRRKARTAEQSLVEACQFVRAFLLGIESKTGKDDPLLEVRRRVHAPLIEKLETAIREFNQENERR